MLNGGVIGFGNVGQQLTRYIGEAWKGRRALSPRRNRTPRHLCPAVRGDKMNAL